jgi:hypothetical protein
LVSGPQGIGDAAVLAKTARLSAVPATVVADDSEPVGKRDGLGLPHPTIGTE